MAAFQRLCEQGVQQDTSGEPDRLAWGKMKAGDRSRRMDRLHRVAAGSSCLDVSPFVKKPLDEGISIPQQMIAAKTRLNDQLVHVLPCHSRVSRSFVREDPRPRSVDSCPVFFRSCR